MDKFVIKNLIVVSLLLGCIFALFAPIPYVGMLALFGNMLFAAPIVMLYLIMDGKLEINSAKDSIIYGAICGLSTNLTFSGIFSIILIIMLSIFNIASNFFLSAVVVNAPLWLLLICIIFIGTLCATLNAFSGFATYYVIEFIRDVYERKSKNGRI